MIKLPLCIILFCSGLTLSAQEKGKAKSKEGKFSRYGAIVDQDLLVEYVGLRNEDRNYTMGFGFFWTNDKMDEGKFFAPFRKLAKVTAGKLSNKAFKADEFDKQQSATFSLGATGFTPLYLGDDIINKMDSIQYDRPFSSLTFLSIKFQTATPKKVETNQVVFGLLGLHMGGEVQAHIHRKHWFKSEREIPLGWKYQLYDGGVPTFLFSNRADFLLNDVASYSRSERKPGGLNAQFIASREYRLGYYTGGSVGFAFKAGWLDPANWASYDTYQLGYATQKKRSADSPRLLRGEFYVQASVRGNVMLYNQHLQKKGRLPDLREYLYKKQYFFLETFAGAGGTIPFCNKSFSINLMAYVSGRTREIKSHISNRNHLWGGMQLAFTRIKP